MKKRTDQLRLPGTAATVASPAVVPDAQTHRVVGLFAGIGGVERGLERAGHETLLFCENDGAANAVLAARFPGIPLHEDVRTLRSLPRGTTLLTGGFPCQDLSQAGNTKGIAGARSGLVGEVFRLIRRQRIPWLLLENVPFMLQLGKGRAMNVVVNALEDLGYNWAYRVVDSRAFGLPQRRRRVFLVASQEHDPRTILFADEAGKPEENSTPDQVACGFYWTEGVRGLGWAIDATPTLKGGSTVGIPSPPAIIFPSGEIVKPDLRDTERLQGFPVDWTKPAEAVGRVGFRWKLVGNAVSVPAAEWIGRRFAKPGRLVPMDIARLKESQPWPTAAWNVGDGRFRAFASEWPKRKSRPSLADFLRYEGAPLSAKATAGFLKRTRQGSLRFPPGFIQAVEAHLERATCGTAKAQPVTATASSQTAARSK